MVFFFEAQTCLLIDEHGIAFDSAEKHQRVFPTIVNTNASHVRIGEHVVTKEEREWFQRVYEHLRIDEHIAPQTAFEQHDELPDEITIQTPTFTIQTLTTIDPTRIQKNLQTALAQARMKKEEQIKENLGDQETENLPKIQEISIDQELENIDLRFEKKIFYKFKQPESEEESSEEENAKDNNEDEDEDEDDKKDEG